MASTEAEVAHVWRRLGFGPSRANIDAGVASGTAALIDDLCSRPATTPAQWAFPTNTDWTINDRYVSRLIELMAYGANPLQERIAWILHGLVVVAMDGTVYLQDMRGHVDMLRSSTFGSYITLLNTVATMPGMLKYLSGHQNTKAHPNENFARELCELFTIGRSHPITGAANYTETDVKEMARALTGWQYNWTTGATFFSASYWDSGNKTFLGADRGAAKLPEVLSAIVAHPSWPYFIPRRSYRELVGLEPDATTLEDLATVWGPTGDLNALVTAIVHRPEFLSDEAIGSRAKSPVELVAAAAKMLGLSKLYGYSLDWQLRDFFGQNPLVAPNVSGWYKGAEWMNPGIVMAWSSMSRAFIWGKVNWDGTGTYPPTVQTPATQATGPTAAAKALSLAGIIDATPQTVAALNDYATSGTWGIQRAAGVMNLLLLSPEFLTN